ncbi:MAG: hypothetical protein M3373_06410, partial [Gemmatimonadota bacterium]|nr:hypothetical protein [Gemmatimonadota bacterium]
WAGTHAARGAAWMQDRGEDALDALPPMDDVVEQVGDYLSAAREAINDTVSEELRDLRKSIRRQRKRIGL